MRRLSAITVMTVLLVQMMSMAWAATKLNSSRSKIYRVTYDSTAVNPTQAAAVLKELDKIGPGVNEATVKRMTLKIRLGPLIMIRIIPANQRHEGIAAILLLKNPEDVPAAIAVTDPGVPADKPSKSTK